MSDTTVSGEIYLTPREDESDAGDLSTKTKGNENQIETKRDGKVASMQSPYTMPPEEPGPPKVEFTGAYAANHSSQPAEVQSLRFPGSLLVLGTNGRNNLMKYRTTAKVILAAGRLRRGTSLQQRWYESLRKELGGRRVSEATVKELVHIAEREGIPVPKKGSLYGKVTVCFTKARKIGFDNPLGAVVGLVTMTRPIITVSVGKRIGRDPTVVSMGKGMFRPKLINVSNTLDVHDKYVEHIIINVRRGERLVGEGFLPISLFSEDSADSTLSYEGKVQILAPVRDDTGKYQKFYDRLFPKRGEIHVHAEYSRSASEELKGLSYRRALINAIGSPISDLPRNLDRKKHFRVRRQMIDALKNSNNSSPTMDSNASSRVSNFSSRPLSSNAAIVPALVFPSR